MTDHAVIEVIERRWSTAHDRGARDYTDEGCRILAERAFKDVRILLTDLKAAEAERDRAIFVGEANDQTYRDMREYYDKRIQAVEAESARLREAQKFLRKEWWLNHGHDFAALYGDDGEMSCGACPADFRRMPLDVLYGYVVAGRGARAALEGEKP